MLQSTDPELLRNIKCSRGDEQISLRRMNEINFSGEVRAGGDGSRRDKAKEEIGSTDKDHWNLQELP